MPLPVEVRHVVPVLLHQQLAAVRGFNPLFEDSAPHDFETLHALRIAFKRLRYATSTFTDVLGPTSAHFIMELKTVQDHLGRLNDVVVFEERLAKYAGKGKKALDLPALERRARRCAAKHHIAALRQSVDEIQSQRAEASVRRAAGAAVGRAWDAAQSLLPRQSKKSAEC